MNKLLLSLIFLTLLSCNDKETVQKEQLPPAIIETEKEILERLMPETLYDIGRKKDEIKCKTLNGDLRLELLYGKKESMEEERVLGYSQLWSIEEPPKLISEPWIHFLDHTTDSDCTLHAGYLIEDKYLLIPGTRSEPPHDDILIVFVFDYKTRNFITRKSFKKSLYNNNVSVPPITIKNTDGLSYQSWIGRSDATSYTVNHRGETVRADEVDLIKWIKVTFERGKLSDSLDRKKTWERSSFKSHFKTQKDFEKAFDFSEDQQAYTNDATTLEAKFGTFSCVQPRSDRYAIDGKWYCDDFK